MSPHLPGTKPESLEILGKILPPAQIRRFERMHRISQCGLLPVSMTPC